MAHLESAPGLVADRGPAAPAATDRPVSAPLVAHVIHRLDVGGLENGLVNLIDRMPPARYRHAIVCLTGYTEFARRIRRSDVTLHALDKRAGHDPGVQLRLWRLLRQLRPAIVHTRNLSALEAVVPAALARVPVRIHAEHGRDMHDLDGLRPRYRWLRRAMRPFVHRWVALSRDLEVYLARGVGVPPGRLTQIYNGVDSERFHPAPTGREPLPAPDAAPRGAIVLGTVGRLKAVKDPLTLARAFALLVGRDPGARARIRLVLVGDGPLREAVRGVLEACGATDLAWLPGERSDIPQILRGLDVFVLPSLAEGVSNGILEAMASGLPVVATRVGGNPELVEHGASGFLVPRGDPPALAAALERYLAQPDLRMQHGREGRRRAEERFSLERMVLDYLALYDAVLTSAPRGTGG